MSCLKISFNAERLKSHGFLASRACESPTTHPQSRATDSDVSESRRFRALAQTHCALRSAGSVVALGALWPVIDAIHSWMMVARYSVFWASCHMIVSTRRLRRLINGDSLRVVAAADSKEKAAAYLRLLLRIRKRYLDRHMGLSVGP